MPTAVASSTLATATLFTLTATDALNSTISHTTSFPPAPSSTASMTVTTHSLALLSTPSTTATIPVADESVKISLLPPKSVASTSRTITVPTTNVFTPNITIKRITTTLRAIVTPSQSISTTYSVAPSMDMSPTSTKLLTSRSTLPTILTFTTKGTSKTTSKILRAPPGATSTEPAIFSKTSTTKTTPEVSTYSTEAKSTETLTLTKSLALDLSTSATSAHLSVSAPLKTFTVIPPTITQRYSTEFIEAASAFSTFKTTTVSGTREPSMTHTKAKTMLSSSVVLNTSTTHLPVKPRETTQTVDAVDAYPMSMQPVTTKTISGIFDTTTQTTTVPSIVSSAEAMETKATTAFQPISMLYTTHTYWSPGVQHFDETHTTTSWRMSQTTTTATPSTYSIPLSLSESTTKAAVPTLLTSLPVPSLTTHTTVLPSAIAHIISTLPPSHILPTHMTTPITQLVSNGTLVKATIASSKDPYLSSLSYSPSTSAHLSEKISKLKTQPSTSTSTLPAEIKIKTTVQAYTPAVTRVTSASTALPQIQMIGSAGTSRTAEPYPSTTETGFTFYSPAVSSVTLHPKMETTYFLPHTQKSEISANTSMQPWLLTWSTSSPQMTSFNERVMTIVTPKIISTISPTTHKTSRITMETHISPPIVTEKPTTITSTEKMLATTGSLEREKLASQTRDSSTLTFSTIPSTKTTFQMTKNRTEIGPTTTSATTGTSVSASVTPHDISTVSVKTLSLTMSSLDWQRVDERASETQITTEQLPSQDRFQTSSPALLITITTPYKTQTKHWITPTEKLLNLTATVLFTSAKDVSPSKVCTVSKTKF